MGKFAYAVIDVDGKELSGTVKADTIADAKASLNKRGMAVAELREKTSLLQFELTKEKVHRADLMHFSRQLGAFLRAGVPILEALTVLRDGAGNKTLRRVLGQIIDDLRAGTTFHDAAAKHPLAFPPFYLGMVAAAELTGNLDVVLFQLSKYIERDLDTRRKIKSALAYPLVILAMSILTVGVLTVFVMPKFVSFFETLDAKLPLATRILLSTTEFLGTWWWAFAGAGAAFAAGFVLFRRTARGRSVIDSTLLRIPVIGETLRYSIIERICRILSSMVRAGVPLPEALVVAGDTSNNAVYQRGILAVRDEMLRGEGIARPIARTGLFPLAASQMFKVGEETGTLDDQLESSAEYFDQELEYKLKKVTTLFEPAVIILMGLIVGFVAVALVSAMYGVYRSSSTLRP